MDTKAIKREAHDLQNKLKKYNHHYYVLNDPLVSDTEYDILYRKLKTLAEKYPELLTDITVIKEVGSDLPKNISTINKITHPSKMYSLDNLFNQTEVSLWVDKLQKEVHVNQREIYCDPKLDGVALNLVYLNGQLDKVESRGNGEIGEDLTHLSHAITGILQEFLKTPMIGMFEVRGEAMMAKSLLATLNEQKIANNEKEFANTRNAVAGTLRLLDTLQIEARHLVFVPHSFGKVEDPTLSKYNHQQLMEVLNKEDGTISLYQGKLCHTVKDIEEHIDEIAKVRESLPYDIDGVVFKLNDRQLYNYIGYTSKSPKFAIAYKFTADSALTTLRDIILQVGKSGVITPVAVFDPITLKGVTVSKATLHNEKYIQDLQIGIGDEIQVIRSGDVIPKVVLCIHTHDPIYKMPTTCPVCGTETVVTEEGSIIRRCVNADCPSVLKQRLIHFASRDAFNIQGMGPSQIEIMMKHGILRSVVDFFTWKVTDLKNIAGIGQVLAEKLHKSCIESKKVKLTNFIYALGIPNIGLYTAKKLARHYESFTALSTASVEDLKQVLGGEVAAESIYDFLSTEANEEIIDRLFKAGVEVMEDTPLLMTHTKKVVITGAVWYKGVKVPRSALIIKGNEVDIEYTSSVSKKTDLLVIGEKPSQDKIALANKYGVKKMSGEEFCDILHIEEKDLH